VWWKEGWPLYSHPWPKHSVDPTILHNRKKRTELTIPYCVPAPCGPRPWRLAPCLQPSGCPMVGSRMAGRSEVPVGWIRNKCFCVKKSLERGCGDFSEKHNLQRRAHKGMWIQLSPGRMLTWASLSFPSLFRIKHGRWPEHREAEYRNCRFKFSKKNSAEPRVQRSGLVAFSHELQRVNPTQHTTKPDRVVP
jgi:hypothetical protein